MNLARLKSAWRRLLWIKILRRYHPEVEVEVAAGPGRMRVNLRDEWIGPDLFLRGGYEEEFQALMGHFDLAGSVCIDIGANIGVHTLRLSRLVGDEGRVFAFEPERYNHGLLAHNLGLNQIRNVTTRKLAIGDAPGRLRLGLHPHNYGDHRIAAPPGAHDRTFQEIEVDTLDRQLAQLADGQVRLIKLDVQGYEHHAILGMKETLRRNPGAILMVEVFPEALRDAGTSATELLTTLEELGFDGWEFHGYRIAPIGRPWVYELIRDRHDLNLILSRDGSALATALGRWLGRPVPLPR